MIRLSELGEVPRKTLVMFLIIDTSASMAGARIGLVNMAIDGLLDRLKDMNDTNPDAIVEIAILTFGGKAQWLTPNGSVKPENFYFKHLDAVGPAMIGEAFHQLEEKLHTHSGFMQRASGSFAPIIFLVSDAEPSDAWESILSLLKQNKWFNVSAKVALAVGDDA